MRTIVVLAALLLAGCASGSASTGTTPRTPATGASSLSGQDIGLQLRPVLDVQPPVADQCAEPSAAASPTADADAARPVTACSTDGQALYSLGPAVVDGTRWDSLRVTERDGATEVVALVDPVGSSALTQATGELSTNDEPQDQLAVYAEGRVLSAPTIVQPIYGGVVVLGGDLSAAQAQALVDRLTS